MPPPPEPTPDVRAFIERWGEVARAWGLPRAAGRVHGLLLAAPAPLDADDIAAALGIARSSVSTSLKELRALGVVRTAPAAGRRERFAALDDPWEAAAAIAAHRRARELDPAVAALTDAAGAATGEAAKRLKAYAGLGAAAGAWAGEMAGLPRKPLAALMKAGAGVADWLPKKKKKKK